METAKSEIIDKLHRGMEMEEVMTLHLIDACQAEALPADLPDAVRQRVRTLLQTIREDCIRHNRILARMLQQLREDGLSG